MTESNPDRDGHDRPLQILIRRAGALAAIPTKATEGSSGFDLVSANTEPIALGHLERTLVPTGVYLSMPTGIEAQVRTRSGLALKQGIGLVNGIATIDSDYRGEIGILLINWGLDSFTVEPGMRIAQLVFARVFQVEWNEVAELPESLRGAGGFGSSGV